MAPEQNFYKGIQNRTQIEAVLEPYNMSDIEFFGEFVEDLVEDHVLNRSRKNARRGAQRLWTINTSPRKR